MEVIQLGFGDTDWAADKVSRKSTSGGVMQVGRLKLVYFAGQQPIVAQPSCVAEVYGFGCPCMESLLVRRLLQEIGFIVKVIRKHCDNSAARAVAIRLGVRRLRRIDVKCFFIQQVVRGKDVVVEAI